MSNDKRNPGRLYGRVMNVRNESGNVRVDARLLESHGKIATDILVETMAPGMVIVPQVGWIVSMDTDSDGEKLVTGIACGPEVIDGDSVKNGFQNQLPDENERFSVTDNLEPGTIVIQLDRHSGLVYKWNETKNTFDLDINAGGDVTINAGGDITLNAENQIYHNESQTIDNTDEDSLTQ